MEWTSRCVSLPGIGEEKVKKKDWNAIFGFEMWRRLGSDFCCFNVFLAPFLAISI